MNSAFCPSLPPHNDRFRRTERAVRGVRPRPVLLRTGATTARSRRGPTAPISSTSTWRRCGPRSTVAVDDGMPAPTSVFVGGGTPSLVPADGAGCGPRPVPFEPGAEVTVECNPDDVTGELLATYPRRASTACRFGVQSMVPHVLAALGRTHDLDNVERAVAAVRSVGLRLVQPRPHLRRRRRVARRLADDAAAALDLEPPHVSRLRAHRRAGHAAGRRPRSPSRRRRQADEYELADDLLSAAGLANYEVSNWARPGHECRHNLLYWGQRDYRGFGCAAHSHRAGRRWWNVRTPERYIEPSPPGGRPRRPARRSMPRPAGSRDCSSRCAPGPVCRLTHSTVTHCPVSWNARDDRWCSPDAAV